MRCAPTTALKTLERRRNAGVLASLGDATDAGAIEGHRRIPALNRSF
jgi:hypothetical protein